MFILLLVVTFAAYLPEAVDKALHAAVDRGVQLRFVFESEDVSEGKVSSNAAKALGPALLARSALCVWPLARRPRSPSGDHGSLHVKCAVADREVAFVSSANLTGYAMTINMELGLLVRGGPVPGSIAEHFDALVEGKILEKVT